MTTRTIFDQLYDDNFDYAFRLARLFGAPPGYEEDVAQEVFFAMSQAMKDNRFVAMGSPRPWLRTAIYRGVRDLQRGTFHRRRVARDIDEGDVPVPAAAEGLAALGEDAALLLRFLDVLDEQRRAVFVLHEILGHTLPEIATDLEISLSTATKRLQFAREDLAAALRRYQATQARTMRGAYLEPLTVAALVAAFQACSLAITIAVPLGMRERAWARLQERIRSVPASTPALDPSWNPPRFSGKGHLISGGAGFAAGVAATLLLVAAHRHREAPLPPLASERTSTVVVAPTDPAYVRAILPVQTPAATTAPATPTASSAVPQPDPDAEAHAERRCLRAARAALDATPPHPRKALHVLAECAQRFPTSRLPAQRARLQQEVEAALAASQR